MNPEQTKQTKQPTGPPNEKQDGENLPPISRLPDHAQFDQMLGDHMAKAAKDYDDAIGEMKNLHKEATLKMSKIQGEIDEIRPIVEKVMSGELPFNKSRAKKCLQMMRLESRYAREKQATYSCAAANCDPDDPKRPEVGGAMGRPVGEREEVERWPDEQEDGPADVKGAKEE